MNTTTLTAPAVYVSTYKKYNNGSLDGEWVKLTDFADYDEFMDYLRELHSDESCPEFMFQDFEGFPRELYSEYGMDEETFNEITQYGKLCEIYDEESVDAYYEVFGRGASIDDF